MTMARVDVTRARALLRDGADIHAAAAPGGPTPLSLAQAMHAAGDVADSSAAQLVLDLLERRLLIDSRRELHRKCLPKLVPVVRGLACARCPQLGDAAIAIKCDVSKAEDVAAAVAKTCELM